MDLLSSLNPQQAEAVKATEGPLLDPRRCGSGKTRVITVRIAYLIAEKKVAPHNILAVTFTNKAAGEMKARVEELLKGERLPSAPLISTFHSLCVRMLRQDIEKLEEGYKKSFTIYDTDDSQQGRQGMHQGSRTRRKTDGAAECPQRDHLRRRTAARMPRCLRQRSSMAMKNEPTIAKVFRMYDERLNTANALDFDDLLIKTVKLLRRLARDARESTTTDTNTFSSTSIRTRIRCSSR